MCIFIYVYTFNLDKPTCTYRKVVVEKAELRQYY